MKTKSLKITKPCSENWDKMTASEQGKFCASCNKNILDFTHLTPEEIIEQLKKVKGKTCVRLTQNQQNTPIVDFKPSANFKIPYSKTVASLLLLASFTSADANVPFTSHKPTPYKVTENYLGENLNYERPKEAVKKTTNHSEHIVFNGKVIAQIGDKPIENALVTFISLDKTVSTYSQSDGSFSLSIPNHLVCSLNVIRFSYDEVKESNDDKPLLAFFKTNDFVLSDETLKTHFTVKAESVEPIIGEIVAYDGEFEDPVVIVNGFQIDYQKFITGKYRNSGKETKTQYFFRREAAIALYGEEAKNGLFLFVDERE